MSSVIFLMNMRKLMNLERYQNMFRFVKTSIADHEWNVSKIAYWLAKMDEELFDKQVKMDDVLKKALHHDTMKFYVGDIQSNEGNADLIKYVRSAVYPLLFDEVIKPMLSEDTVDAYQNFVLNSMSKDYEGSIVYVANKIDKLLEAEDEIRLNNGKHFNSVKFRQYKLLVEFLEDEDYEKSLSSKMIIYYMLLKEKNIIQSKFVDFLNKYKPVFDSVNREYVNKFLKYFSWSRELLHTKRYQNLTRLIKRNVSSHGWSVARIATFIALNIEKTTGTKINYEKLLLTALEHDSIESSTGDFLSHIKRITPEMLNVIEEIENVTFDSVVKKMIPDTWCDVFKSAILNPKDDTLEGSIIVMADAMDVIFECYEEIQLGNRKEFLPILINNTMFLKNFNYDIIQSICREIETDLIYGI